MMEPRVVTVLNDNVITKLNLHQSAFSADFFNGDIQIRETSLQALILFPPPTPSPQQIPKPRARELARRLGRTAKPFQIEID